MTPTAISTDVLNVLNQPFNLTPADLRHLESGFITREIAEAAKLRRVSDELGAELIGKTRKAGKDYAGEIFPYFLPPNSAHPRAYRLRRDTPDVEQKENGELKETAKYLSAPGARNSFYFVPETTAEMLKDISLPIVYFEGEKKALAGKRLANEDSSLDKWHFLPIGLSGVWNWRSNNIGKTAQPSGEKVTVGGAIPDFQHMALKGRKVIILFDANVRTNPQVKAARFQLSETLKAKGAQVLFADLPEDCDVNGIDDYLGKIEREKGTAAALKVGFEIIDGAMPPPKRTTNPIAQSFELVEENNTEGLTPGVYCTEETGERFLICSPLKILAETQTENGENYGRDLEWRDSKGRLHRWAVPMDFLHGEGFEFVKYLVSRGLELMPSKKHREKLTYYIATSKPEKTTICTEKTGWHGETYVLPDETFGGRFNVVLQSENNFHKFNVKGTLEEWQEHISKLCVNNSRLAFGVSAAFASMLLSILNVLGGGFHFRGSSSTGKTTAAHVAGSTFGGSDDASGYCETWKATANGLESVAASHNHALLCLDEIGECDSRQVGDIQYMLANGEGKRRMAKTVTARKPLTWQLLYISTGEIRLADKMREAGQTIKGGQEVRFCDIEADTGAHGIFEDLHGFPDGQTLSDHLRVATKEFYGTAARAFLRQFVALDREEVRSHWREFQTAFTAKLMPAGENQTSEVSRVATRFALVAFAGEMASKFGVTGWQRGEAVKAAEIIFNVWRNGRIGAGGTDAENAIRQIRLFLENHGQSRFQTLGADASENEKVVNRVGFKRKNHLDEIEYLVLPESFRSEVCKGLDSKTVAKVLAERGLLKRDSSGKYQTKERCGEANARRVYVITSNVFEGASKDEQDV